VRWSGGGLGPDPEGSVQLIILSVQVLAGIMLPSAIIFLQLLLNDKEMLGERFTKRPWNNIVKLDHHHRPVSLVLALQVVAPKMFPVGERLACGSFRKGLIMALENNR
jgi:hypothetical protein